MEISGEHEVRRGMAHRDWVPGEHAAGSDCPSNFRKKSVSCVASPIRRALARGIYICKCNSISILRASGELREIKILCNSVL